MLGTRLSICGDLIVFRAIVNHAVETGALAAKPFRMRLLKQHKRNLEYARPGDPVFQMKAGVRWTTRLINVINALYRDAGLYSRKEKSGLHQCRRTYATTLLDSGVSIEAVRSLGRWASLGIVQNYVTSSDRVKRDAVERLPF